VLFFFTLSVVVVVFGCHVCHVMHVMSRCLGRRCFDADGGRQCRCFVVFFFFLFLRHEAASRTFRCTPPRFFFLWFLFFSSFLCFSWTWHGSESELGLHDWTGWGGTGSRYVGKRCLDVVNGYHASCSYPPTLALPHPNICCCSCFCLSASLAASSPLPAAPCPVNAARTTHHTPQTHHPVPSAAQPSPSRVLHPANSLTRPLTCLTPHIHSRHVSRTSIPFSRPAGPPLPRCVALGRLVCATPGFEGAGGRGSSQGPHALIAGTRWYLGRSPGLHCCALP
jgi:hypothetical protein